MKVRTITILSAIALSLLALIASRISFAQAAPAYVPGEILVGELPEAEQAWLAARTPNPAASVGAIVGNNPRLHSYRVKLGRGMTIEAAIAHLAGQPGVLYAEPNYIVHSVATPNDTYYATKQYGPQKIQANLAWEVFNPQMTTIIAIVDTGVDSTHPDLTNIIYRDASGIVGYNAITNPEPDQTRNNALDDFGHGTHCAGIAAAEINNGTGVAGIAGWNPSVAGSTKAVKIMPVKVLDNTGSGSDQTVSDGITWAADHGARIISMSLGDSQYSSPLDSACQYAWGKGCLIVAAAGNSASSSLFYPAGNANVISVAATDSTDTLASFSNWGSWVKIAAPGVNIWNTLPTYATSGGFGTNYGSLSGTSMATPHVAGAAALVWGHLPTLLNSQLTAFLQNNTDAYNQYAGRTIGAGAGRLNVYKALVAATGIPPIPTGPFATAGDTQVALSWTASTGATSYNIYRGTTAGGEAATPIKTGVTASPYTDTGLTNGTTYYYKVTAVNAGGESAKSNETSATPTSVAPSASASFVGTDTSTQGSWKGVYGADGYNISQLSASLPAYASLSLSGNSNYTWASSTTDVRALQKVSTSDRIAACWYSSTSFTLDLNLTDGVAHNIAFYCLDWDTTLRAAQIDVIDAGTSAVLSTQTVSSYHSGVYMIWSIKGHVKIKFTKTGGANATLSGVFFGGSAAPLPPAAPTNLGASPGNAQVALSWTGSAGATSYNVYRATTSGGEGLTPIKTGVTASPYTDTGLTNGTTYYYKVTAVNAGGESAKSNEASATPTSVAPSASASFVGSDTSTQGSWKGVYGADGYNIAQLSASLPAYASLSLSGNSNYTWASSTTDVRALQKVSTSDRIAACWYSSTSFTLDLNLTDGVAHNIALYCLDWDTTLRAAQIDVLDAGTNAVLNTQTVSAYHSGVYMIWSIKGHVKIKFTKTGGANTVLSGVYFN